MLGACPADNLIRFLIAIIVGGWWGFERTVHASGTFRHRRPQDFSPKPRTCRVHSPVIYSPAMSTDAAVQPAFETSAIKGMRKNGQSIRGMGIENYTVLTMSLLRRQTMARYEKGIPTTGKSVVIRKAHRGKERPGSSESKRERDER